MMNKVLSPKSKRASTSSNSLYRHKSTVLSSSLFLSKPKYTNMSYDNKPRRNSCVTKSSKQSGNSTKSLQRIKQSLNIHSISNELANSVTNFSIGNITLPEVSDPQAFIEGVRTMALQRSFIRK